MAAAVLDRLLDLGLTLEAQGDRLLVAGDLTDPLRDLIRSHKAELMAAVRRAEDETACLLSAIREATSLRGDSAQQTAALIEDCLRQSRADKLDLTEHFEEQAALWRKVTGADR